MAKHLSIRLPWHDRGWDGHVCDRPTANVFCTGEYGLKPHGIREGKNDVEEEARRSKPCAFLPADKYRRVGGRKS
jgi:exodeoxyribonuclease V alpha subunit